MSVELKDRNDVNFTLRGRVVSGEEQSQYEPIGHAEDLYDNTVSVASSATINTSHNTGDITLPARLHDKGRASIKVYNPAEYSITVRPQNKKTVGGVARYFRLDRVTVDAGDAVDIVIEGVGVGEAFRVEFTNDAANNAGADAIRIVVTAC